ncbi:MAG: hypothetical protein ABJC88_16895 [Parasphingorhabdus sp.]|uniref:hypothetical protein n=1 Tax=Sphingomonadales TaxID=204457 RepID=UPI003262F4C7
MSAIGEYSDAIMNMTFGELQDLAQSLYEQANDVGSAFTAHEPDSWAWLLYNNAILNGTTEEEE